MCKEYVCPRCGRDGFPSIYMGTCTNCANILRGFGGYYAPSSELNIQAWHEKQNRKRYFSRKREELDRLLEKLFV